MTLDTTRHGDSTDLELRPGSENPAVPDAPGVSRDESTPVYSGHVIPAQSAGNSAFHGQHPAYAPLPLHVAALIDNRSLPAAPPAILETMRQYHLWPSVCSVGFSALGWWANLEPNHIWLMLPFLGGGLALPAGGWLAHHKHADGADRHLTRGLFVGGAVGMSGAAAVGAGLSGISALTTALLAAVGTLGSVGWREHRRQRDQDFVVDYHSAVASAPMPPAPVGGVPLPPSAPGIVGGGLMSDQAARLHAAFAAIGVSPIQVDAVRTIGPDAWLTYIYTPESKTVNFRWLSGRVDTLRNNMRCRGFQIIPTAIGNRFEIRVQDGEDSALDDVTHWPGPNTDDITQPVNIGIDDAKEIIALLLKGRHTLYAGITDGGKSIGVNVIACAVASMKNAVLVLMDLKPGQLELGPYEPVAYRAAFGIDDAKLLLQALGAAMEVRGQVLREERERTGKPVKEWDPNRHGPAIVVLIDELAEMLRLDANLFELWIRLMQVARALGIYLIGATQSPSSKALGGTTDGSGQFTNMVCYRTRSATQTNVILGPGAHGEGWRADESSLPLKGMFRPRTPEYPRPSKGRGYMIEPDRIMATVNGNADSRPALDERTAVAMEEILGGRCNPGNPTGPGGGRPVDAIDAANDFHADVRYLRAVPDLYPDKSEVEPEHLAAWRLFTEVGTLTIRELLGYNLPGLGSRESCTKMLNLFKNHKGATSQRDPNDGRSERFFCTAQPKRRSREA
jgi:hypothetical protein